MQIIGGLIGAILSLLLIIYRERVYRFTGAMGWAESYLGPGGTFTAFLLMGLIGFFASLMVMTGTFDFLLGGIGTKFFGGLK